MTWFKNLMIKMIGKKVGSEAAGAVGQERWDASKTKMVAVIYILLLGTEELSKAWGHPIVIPPSVYDFLKGMGLWAVRDAIPPKA